MKQYKYFVVYSATHSDGRPANLTGNCELTRSAPIRGHADITSIQQTLCNGLGLSGVLLTNWQRFEPPVVADEMSST